MSDEDTDLGTEQPAGYDAETMGEVLTADEYSNSPEWFRDRLSRMAQKKQAAESERDRFRTEMDSLRNEFGQIRAKIDQPAPAAPAQDQPFLKKASEDQLKAAATRIMGLQELARDPDATPEERGKAKEQLAGLGDAASTLFDIQQEIADRRASFATGQLREEVKGQTAAQQRQSALVQRLFSSFGAEAINQNSPLSKAAFAKLRGWANDYGITADQVSEFMTIKAFEEAAHEQSKTLGRRGADPRSSAVLGSTGSARAAQDDPIEGLLKKAEQGDFRAARKASQMKLERFFAANGIDYGKASR